ncbi:MAG: glycosyltransferase family 4 protein [Parcubacteria group bacterium]|nr:glycosyltransferase family 4 protein [Parcubacteria group bacterium]
MKIIYISNSRIPTEKAYGISIVKTCEALVENGARVTLLIPRVQNLTGNDLFSYYGIKKNFSVKHVSTIDAVKLGWKYSFLINQISFGISAFFLYKRNKKDDVIITRDEISGWLLSMTGRQVFYDIHGFPESRLWMWKIILRRFSGIFATNNWKAQQCHSVLGIPKEKIIIARNGFDPKIFFVKESASDLRKQLNLPDDKPVALYVGHLYDWKGVYVLAEAARIMPYINFVFVGGTYYDRADFQKKYNTIPNIVLVEQQPYKKIPLYLKSADALVLPNSGAKGKDPRLQIYSQRDTSPIKLFEYMASGVPIVASDLPSIREILNQKNAVLVKPDNSPDLKRGIEIILNDKKRGECISKKALEDVKEYTWEKRAEIILRFIKSTN